jgi:hypothetical protein
MRLPLLTLSLASLAALGVALVPAADPVTGRTDRTWKKTVLDTVFRSEGCAIADVNKDGKMDVLNGEFWYEAPTWKKHEMIKPGDYGTGQKSYSNTFACWAEDLNKDGYPDLITINFPGAPCFWMENPGAKGGHWKRHEIWHSACNETPQYVDLFGKGKKVLVMGFQPKASKGNQGQMAYFEPDPNDATKPWIMHPISVESQPGKEVPGTQRFSHGLGIGDVNGDGRADVIVTAGWWEQPEAADGKTPWKFHPINAGIPATADIYTYDLNGDKAADLLCSSAHQFGIWSYEQRASKPGTSPSFVKVDMFPQLVSETHAMVLADINGDGAADFVTGKRWWSHGRAEPGADWPAMLYWFEARKITEGPRKGMTAFTPRVIDTDSGVGTQFTVADLNGDGLLDVAVSNKRGTFIFEQGKAK